MVLVEDDSILHPEIDEDTSLYIHGLNERHQPYERFFDALLIKRSQHRAFFRDLKAFREQAQVISLLDRAGQDKTIYREITLVYLDSRFAHPWCRKTPLKRGFWRSEWGSIQGKERDAEAAREEARLHKLLVPVWIIMRSRMFPGKQIVTDWCVQERERRKIKQGSQLTMAALKMHDEGLLGNSLKSNNSEAQPVSDAGMDDEERRHAAHAAASVFRLAAAGVILSQQPKRKLRWLTRKPS